MPKDRAVQNRAWITPARLAAPSCTAVGLSLYPPNPQFPHLHTENHNGASRAVVLNHLIHFARSLGEAYSVPALTVIIRLR